MKKNHDYLLVYKGDISRRPPLLTLIELLIKKGKRIIIMVNKIDDNYMIKLKKIGVLVIKLEAEFNTFTKPLNKILYWLKFRKQFKMSIKKLKYKTIWFCSADTAIALKGLYKNINYYISVYELYDTNSTYKFFLKNILLNAKKVIVPEENRAAIFKSWYNLKIKPFVLPNKPIAINNNLEVSLSQEIKNKILKGNQKILLYQGGISKKARNLTPLCYAVNKLSDKWKLVLMGPKDPYIEELKEINESLIYIPYIKPPLHLEITKLADLCVVAYHYNSLNNLFCAPNKIWEYSMFGKPMLCNDIPCLKGTVERYNAGICVDMDDVNTIIRAITEIELNYDNYTKNAKIFYNSIDLDKLLERILSND